MGHNSKVSLITFMHIDNIIILAEWAINKIVQKANKTLYKLYGWKWNTLALRNRNPIW